MKKYFLYYCFFLLTACYRNEPPASVVSPSIVGTWMGGAYELDQEVYNPIAQIMQFDTNGMYHGQWMNQEKADTLEWSIQGDSLRIDTVAFPLHDFRIEPQKLTWESRYPRYYHRMEEVPPLGKTAEEVAQILQQSIWINGEEKLYFQEDHQLRVASGKTGGFSTFCYRVDSVGPHLLLVKHGNQQECGVVYQFLEHFVALDEEQFTVLRWEVDHFAQVKYRAQPLSERWFSTPTDFQLCNRYTYLHTYYQRFAARDVEYPGGLYHINKVFKEKYKPPRNAHGETGLVRIRFVVNCEGRAGMYEMLELDRNYKPRKFDKRITSQILDICKELQDWRPPEKVRGEVVDVYKMLLFKMKNGKIVEVFY